MEDLFYGKQIEEKHYDAQLQNMSMFYIIKNVKRNEKRKDQTLWFCLLWKESTDRKIRKDVIIEYGIFSFTQKRSFK